MKIPNTFKPGDRAQIGGAKFRITQTEITGYGVQYDDYPVTATFFLPKQIVDINATKIRYNTYLRNGSVWGDYVVVLNGGELMVVNHAAARVVWFQKYEVDSKGFRVQICSDFVQAWGIPETMIIREDIV